MSNESKFGQPKTIDLSDAEKCVGGYIVVVRNGKQVPVKVISVDKKKEEIEFEIICGEESGLKEKRRYYSGRPIDVYDETNVMLALMKKGEAKS